MANGRHSYVPFYPSDWLAGTARLPRLHRSIYFDVCCYVWDHAKKVPEGELRLMCGDLKGWQHIINDLVEGGKLIREGGFIWNERALTEAIKAQDLTARKSAGGRKSAVNTPDKSLDNTPSKTAPIEPEPEPDKEGEEEEPPVGPPREKRGSKLLPDFDPVLTEKAQDNADKLGQKRYLDELEQFRDYHTARSSIMKDWQAAFRTWLANAVKYEKGRNDGKRSGWIARA